MATPEAQQAFEEYVTAFGGRPVHHTLANHWARVIEMMQAAETIHRLANDPEITGTEIRTLPTATPTTGIGVVEAPRANLIVATQNNAGRIAMSVDKAAKALIHGGNVNEGLLNKIEMAFRAYDPCNACATHAQGSTAGLTLRLRNSAGEIIREISW